MHHVLVRDQLVVGCVSGNIKRIWLSSLALMWPVSKAVAVGPERLDVALGVHGSHDHVAEAYLVVALQEIVLLVLVVCGGGVLEAGRQRRRVSVCALSSAPTQLRLYVAWWA